MPARRTRSAGLAPLALLVSGVLLGPAFARADTLGVSGAYSSPSRGTFSGTLTTNYDYTTAVDITFPQEEGFVSDFTYIYDSFPDGKNWALTAYDDDGLELDLTFSTNPTPGSLVGFTGGTIVDGQVLDPKGGFALFQGFSGTISPSLSSGSAVPEPSALALLALGFLAFGLAGTRARNRKRQD